MSSAYPSAGVAPHSASVAAGRDVSRPRRLSTETKASYKTSELFIYLASVVGVLLASWAIGTEDGHDDYFRADRAWLLVVLLTIGYLVSRGLAKAGSRERYDTH
jgi:hypothetical protein